MSAEADLGALAADQERLLSCVHCGFCLPACPTYVRIGDEADSPRGRLVLMRAVAEGRLDPGHDAFQTHIDRCLGCRACETVCPSGVEYGHLLERARQVASAAKPRSRLSRAMLGLFRRPRLLATVLGLARVLRASRVPALAARAVPTALTRLGLGAGMLAASRPTLSLDPGHVGRTVSAHASDSTKTVAVLRGCVQAGLFAHVNRATERVLAVNGFKVVPAAGQGCCGALHAHAGALHEARELARVNVRAFEASRAEVFVTNSAGCGAALREYRELLADDPEYADRGARLVARVRDVTELLAEGELRTGAVVHARVAYDAPCHLHHGQRVTRAPLLVLESIPELSVSVLASSEECCGGAGIYGITHPELGARMGTDKVADISRAGAEYVATGNPGCIMQIGAAALRHGLGVKAVHPVELLDESYRRAGLYDSA